MTKKWLAIDLCAWFLIAMLCCLMACSCNPQKRLNRIISKHPYLAKDSTYIIHDTTVTKAFSFDTLYNFTHSTDTVYLKQHNVTVKAYHYHDSIYIGATVKADTIYKTITLPTKQFNVNVGERKKWLFLWIGIAGTLFLLAVLNMIFKIIKI